MNKNIPKLRFNEFNDEWQTKKLGEVAERITLKNKVNNLNVLTISAQYGLISQLDFFNKSVSAKDLTGYYLLKKGDFAYNKSYSNGYPMGAIKKLKKYDSGVVSTLYICFRVSSINDNFLEDYFETGNQNKEIEKFAQEGARNHGLLNIGVNDFFDIHISFPTLPEQEKIADFLMVVDEKLEKMKEKKQYWEQYKKGIMQKIFSQEIRFKDNNGNNYPDWQEKRLGEIGDFQTSSVDKNIIDGQEEVYLVNFMNVYRHEVIDNSTKLNLQKVTASHTQIIQNNLLKGDILFTPSSETPIDIGKSIVIFEDLTNCVYSYHLMRFRPKIKLSLLYSHYFCNIADVLKQFSTLSTGSTRFTLSLKSFGSIIIHLPSYEEQTKIADFLSSIDAKIEQIHSEILELSNWKKGLLQQMFV